MTKTEALQGSLIERDKEIKSIFIKMVPGERPQIDFMGFWNGRMLQAAINSISKAYRTRRHDVLNTKRKEEGNETAGE